MKKEIKVGIFAVLVLLAGWGVARFLKGAEIFSNSHKYYAHYEQVGGIQPASHVFINGVQVGTVTAVELDANPANGVKLELSIDKQYRIPADSKARIFNDGLMGGKAVEIIYGTSSKSVPAGGTIKSVESVDLMAKVTDEFDDIKQQITNVTESLVTTLDNLNTLLEQNTDGINGIVNNVNDVTGNINTILVSEKHHLEQALASLSKFSQSLGNNAEQIDTIIDNMSEFSGKLAQAELIANLENTVNQLNSVLAAVNDESGSIGMLLHDKALYDNLASSSANLSALLADLKEHPGRYVHFSVFGSDDDKVAKKEAKVAKKQQKKEAKAAKKANK